jgi:hypothetical protein
VPAARRCSRISTRPLKQAQESWPMARPADEITPGALWGAG